MQANRNIHLCQKKAPIYELSRSKAPKNNKLAVTRIRQKPVDFSTDTARAPTLAPTIIYLCAFAKVSVPVGSIISLL